MADKWERSIKGDFNKASAGQGGKGDNDLTLGQEQTKFKNDKLDNPARGPKHPQRAQGAPAPSPNPGTTHQRWDAAEQANKTQTKAREFDPKKDSLSQEFNKKAEKKTAQYDFDKARKDNSMTREFNRKSK